MYSTGCGSVAQVPERNHMNATQQFALTALAALSLVLPVQAAHLYRLTDLGDLPGGADSSNANAINNSGQVVGASGAATGSRAFVWTSGGGMVDVGDLPGGDNYSVANGINDNGQVVGISIAASGARAFLWTSGSGMMDLGDLPGGRHYSSAHGINDSGQIVGGSGAVLGQVLPLGDHAFLWTTASGMQDIGELPGGYDHAWASAINNSGQVVGTSPAVSGYRAFLWASGGGMMDLGTLRGGTDESFGHDINESGQVVGSSRAADFSYSHAFLWTSGAGMTDLGELPGGPNASYARGINDSGEVVGYSDIEGSSAAFLWTSFSGMRNLNDLLDVSGTGWALFSAMAINNSGQIVGTGSNPDGHSRAYLLTPAPELQGDYNQNGTVDAADYVVWRKSGGLQEGYNSWRANFGQADSISPSVPGDYNLDGTLDAADYIVWRKIDGTQAEYDTWCANFGNTAGSGSALPSAEPLSAAVPEPGTIVLLAMTILLAIGTPLGRRI